jgi:hypothetical protein
LLPIQCQTKRAVNSFVFGCVRNEYGHVEPLVMLE